MKKLLFISLFGLSHLVKTQTNTFPSSGNSGIGTLSPTQKLDIRVASAGDGIYVKSSSQSGGLHLEGNGGHRWALFSLGTGDGWGGAGGLALYDYFNSPSYPRLFLKASNGFMGLGGNVSPDSYLHINTTAGTGLHISADNSSQSTGMVIDHTYTGNFGFGSLIKVSSDLTKAFSVERVSGGSSTTMFMIYGNGVVNAKSVYAEALTVTPSAIGITYPDYVFKKDYKLMPLLDLEKYINENKHLPNVPSVEEVKKDGLNIYEINKALLEKVEELTLHMISLKKEIDKLKEKK